MTTKDTYDVEQADLLDAFERAKNVWRNSQEFYAYSYELRSSSNLEDELEAFKAWWELERASSSPEA